MMTVIKNSFRSPLPALSLGLNLAFIAMWLLHALPGWQRTTEQNSCRPGQVAASLSLHRRLDLTADQWQQIEPLVLQFQQTVAPRQQEVMRLRQQLWELLAATPADKTAIKAKQDEILAGQRQMQDMVVTHLLKEKEILSPQQGQQLIQALCEQCPLEQEPFARRDHQPAPETH